MLNKSGDAIFTSAITGVGITFPIFQTVIGFTGKALIVGVRGKFIFANGAVNYNGSFSVVDPNDVEFKADGWIIY